MKNTIANKKELHSKEILLTCLKHRKSTIFPIVTVFCLPVLLYMQTLSFDFTYADDNDIIINNITFLSNFRNAPQAFLKDAFIEKSTPLYRPLQTLSYMGDILLSGGNNPWMYHLTNILFLGLIACLMFLLFRKLLIPVRLAFLSTLVYCAHPLFISSIAWIPARGDLLLLLFSLLSFLFFIEFLQKRKLAFLFLNWIAFTIALFCKETAISLPLLFVIYYFAFASEKRFEKKLFLNIVLYAVSGIFWFWMRFLAVGNISIQRDVILRSLISNLRTIPESVTNFFLPFDIDLIPSFSHFKTLGGLGIIIMLFILLFTNKERSKKEKVFCLSWFLLLLLPTMFYKTEFIDYLNHRFFLPLIGILIFVLFTIPKTWREKNSWLIIVLLLFLSSITFVKARSYSGPITFWNFSVSQNPDNALVYNNRGYVKYSKSDFQEAIYDYTKAIALSPKFALAYYNRGNAYEANGHPEEAIKDYDKAIELNPNNASAFYNRGNAYRTKGNLTEAIKDYNKTIELNSIDADAYNNRGSTYNDMGYTAMAIKDFDKAIELDPNFALAYTNRGNTFGYMGDHERAIRDYDKAIELDPYCTVAYTNRGLAFYIKGNIEEAIKNLSKSIELNPNFANAYAIRGVAYYNSGYLTEAIHDYNKTIELNTNDANAYFNRGVALKANGMLKEAEQDFKMYEELKNKYMARSTQN